MTQAIRYLRDNGLLRSDQEEHFWASLWAPARHYPVAPIFGTTAKSALRRYT
jgi:hypothetical protein